MTEPVLLADRIRTSIELGESHFREFKSGFEGPPASKTARPRKEIAKDICSTLVGFANADGGTLLVGVEDDGIVTGLELRPAMRSIYEAVGKMVFTRILPFRKSKSGK